MPRPPRADEAGGLYHALNRGNGRATIFHKDADFEAFEQILADGLARYDVQLFSFQLMPNHWHLVLRPQQDGAMSQFLRWVTATHTMRYHAHYHTAGAGHVYQGRFKSFPVQDDGHFFTVCRYVERNAMRTGLVRRAENWRWGSLWRWLQRPEPEPTLLSPWPLPRLPRWVAGKRSPDQTGTREPADERPAWPAVRRRRLAQIVRQAFGLGVNPPPTRPTAGAPIGPRLQQRVLTPLISYAGNDPINFSDPSGLSAQGNPLNNFSLNVAYGGYSGGVVNSYRPIDINPGQYVAPALQTSVLSTGLGYSGSRLGLNDYSLAPRSYSTGGSTRSNSISTGSLVNYLTEPKARSTNLATKLYDPLAPSLASQQIGRIYEAQQRAASDQFYQALIAPDYKDLAYANRSVAERRRENADLVTQYTPGLNDIRDFKEMVNGYDSINERQLSTFERVVTGVAFALPFFLSGRTARNFLQTESFDTHTLRDLQVRQQYTHQIDVLPNSHIINQIDTFESVERFPIGGPYSYLVDPPSVKTGAEFTVKQRAKILQENRLINGGQLTSDQTGAALIPSTQATRGTKRPLNEAQVDHIVPLSKRGTNSFSNAQVLSMEENLKKGNRR